MMTFFRLLNAPRLYWVYMPVAGGPDARTEAGSSSAPAVAGATTVGQAYVPELAEGWGQSVVSWVKFFTELGIYVAPLFLPYFCRRLEGFRENPRPLADFAFGVSCVYVLGLILRACGRVTSPTYKEFAEVLRKANQNFDTEAKEALSRYDFEFWAWPVEFNAKVYSKPNKLFVQPPEKGTLEKALILPHRCLGWAMMNTFGLKLIYPGSTKWLFQALVGPAITEHRAMLVAKHKGERFKIQSADGNHVDSMFFDRRAAESSKGETLVICCEGNAGFYEMGMLTTPLEAGYSVVGWNHPGFWGSTGSPLPSQDAEAADAVMQLAIHKLGFETKDIVVYGWSIGGFTASWLAMNYPDLKAVILDATFDHLTPLAVPKMPQVLEGVVRVAIEDNVNLDVAKQIVEYPGPLRLVRRTKDEMISTDESNVTVTNRGNDLLVAVFEHRYPQLMTSKATAELLEYLAKDKMSQELHLRNRGVDEGEMDAYLASYSASHGDGFPSGLGEGFDDETRVGMVLYLASKYRTEFESQHNTPLPVDLFEMPWQQPAASSSS